MIDIGANLGHNSFDHDLEAVLNDAKEVGISHILVTGTDMEGNRKAMELVARFPDFLSCTAGVHPHHADEVIASPTWLDELKILALDDRVRALGETGLDFHRNFAERGNQESVFLAQLDLAEEIGKPLFVHERDTGGRVAELLQARRGSIVGAVVHCFTGTREDLARYLDAGFMIGITGWVCDERRGGRLRELVPEIPDDRLMIETDAPYLTPRNMPRPYPRRNQPANLVWVLTQLAELRGQETAFLAEVTAENAWSFFGLDKATS